MPLFIVARTGVIHSILAHGGYGKQAVTSMSGVTWKFPANSRCSRCPDKLYFQCKK
jgi:hypothetical protein